MKTFCLFANFALWFVLLFPCMISPAVAAGDDPLASWNEGPAKQSIVAFVQKVTQPESTSFVPATERIAVFDNDGTLWPEYPLPFQLAFALDEVKRQVAENPSLAEDPMVQAALAGNFAKLMEGKHHVGLMRILALTHAGMTTEEFSARVEDWMATAQHPRFQKPYIEITYQPMQELLRYLRANGFKTFIVSGGGADFMRVWSAEVYGIPPEQVVGSTGQVKYQFREGVPVLVKTLDQLFVDDREGKPVAIHQFIGRRPIACFGNSDGDQAMLEYTTINNPLPSFGMIVHHTDAEREYAYDADAKLSGKLTTAITKAAELEWIVVDMKSDWNQIWTLTADEVVATVNTPLAGKWLVEAIAGRGVIDSAQTTIEFVEAGRVSGNTSVNLYSGGVTIDGKKICFERIAATRRAGPPALMDQESKFLRALEQVQSLHIAETGLLYLTDSENRVLLRCARKN